MLKKLMGGLLALRLILIPVILWQPSEYRVERTIRIQAPPCIVFDPVNNFHN